MKNILVIILVVFTQLSYSQESIENMAIWFNDPEIGGESAESFVLYINPEVGLNLKDNSSKPDNNMTLIKHHDASSFLILPKYFLGGTIETATISFFYGGKIVLHNIKINNCSMIGIQEKPSSTYSSHFEKYEIEYESIEWIYEDKNKWDESEQRYGYKYKWGWDFKNQKPIDYGSNVQNYMLH